MKAQEINRDELLKFIAKAHRNTYAAPKEISKQFKCQTPILPGHKDYHFIEGDWAYHDSYAGQSWAPGREVVFLKGNPVWTMSYQGQTADLSPEFEHKFAVFFKNALMNFEDHSPFRGPQNFREGDFVYTFNIEGDYKYFKGRESVTHEGIEIFFQDVMGEIVI